MLKVYAGACGPRQAWVWVCVSCALLTAASCKQDWSVPAQNDDSVRADAEVASPEGSTESADASASLSSMTGSMTVGGASGSGRDTRMPPAGAANGGGASGAADSGGHKAENVGGMNAGGTNPGGSGGDNAGGGGAGGVAAAVPVPEPCSMQGSTRCGATSGQPEMCESGAWRASAACAAGEVCGAQGKCVQVSPLCQGSGGKHVCDGQGGMLSCAQDGSLQSQQTCASERLCQLGLSAGSCAQCVPDEYHCDGAKLEQCSPDGQGYATVKTCDSAALCKAESGACTDAACTAGRTSCQGDVLMRCKSDQTGFEQVMTCEAGLCDAGRGVCAACQAGSRSCDGGTNTALICDATGQTLMRNACTAPRGKCVGAGQCVECAADAPCPQSTQVCTTSSCNLLTGSCEAKKVAAGTACALSGRSGVCDAAAACVECLSEGDGHCAGATPHCTSAHTCVRCTANSHCGTSEKCVNGSCAPKCGDGVLDPGEDCERGYLSSNTTNCDFNTCKRLNFLNCYNNGVQCPASTACLGGHYCQPISDKNCVTSCPEVPGMKTSCRTGICYLDCTPAAGGQCPSDMECISASPDSSSFVTNMCFGKTQ